VPLITAAAAPVVGGVDAVDARLPDRIIAPESKYQTAARVPLLVELRVVPEAKTNRP